MCFPFHEEKRMFMCRAAVQGWLEGHGEGPPLRRKGSLLFLGNREFLLERGPCLDALDLLGFLEWLVWD